MFIDEWTDAVKRVCIAGSPQGMMQLAGAWEVMLHRLGTVAASLRDGQKDMATKFTGPAGDAYKTQLDTVLKQIEEFDQTHRPVVPLLQASAQTLATQRSRMDIPDTMLPAVAAAQDRMDLLAFRFLGGSMIDQASLVSAFTIPSFALAKDAITDWDGQKTRDAQNVERALNAAVSEHVRMANDPSPSIGAVNEGGHGVPGAGMRSGGSGGGVGHIPSAGGAGFDPSSLRAGGSASKFGDVSEGGYSGSGFDPAGGSGKPGGPGSDGWTPGSDAWTGTDLSGAGEGGFQAAGGGGGLGSLGGLGGGTGSVGGGSGALGGGPSGGFGSAANGMPGVAAGPAGASAAGAGRGVGGMMAGAGGGAGAGGAGGEERSTWLEEDEDVWGLDDGPGVNLGWGG